MLIGPFPDPITGVSLANRTVLQCLKECESFRPDYINTSYPEFEEGIGTFTWSKFFFYLSLNLQFHKLIQADAIYITPGQTFYGVLKYALFIIFSSLQNKEIILHIHGNHLRNEYESLSGIKKKIFHFLLSKGTKGIVLSETLRKNLSPFMEEKRIHVLFNFAEGYLVDAENEKDFSGMRIVYLSSLMKEKGIFILLEALLELEKRKINYQARIAGNMDPKSKEAILAVMGKLKNTVYLGTVEGTEKKRLLQWSNVFVLPTFYKMEGQPISIIEAMATGNLIVSSRLEGIMDLMRHKEQGFFLKDNSTENLVETLIFIDKNMDLTQKIALNNKDYFLKDFTLSRFREQLLKILNN